MMELCHGSMLGYLQDRERLRTSEARYFFGHLLEGLAFCHSLGISHRDLKLENLMLCLNPSDEFDVYEAGLGDVSSFDLTLKIADFGLAQREGKHGHAHLKVISTVRSILMSFVLHLKPIALDLT